MSLLLQAFDDLVLSSCVQVQPGLWRHLDDGKFFRYYAELGGVVITVYDCRADALSGRRGHTVCTDSWIHGTAQDDASVAQMTMDHILALHRDDRHGWEVW